MGYTPFQDCPNAAESTYVQQYVFTMLVPVGLGMGAFHLGFLKIRRGPVDGPGRAIADGPTIGCCVLGQSVWLIIWASWLSGILSTCGSFDVAPVTIGFSFIGSGIIITVNVVRLYVYLSVKGDCIKFAEKYTGADFSDLRQDYDKVDDKAVELVESGAAVE